jgi:integrase
MTFKHAADAYGAIHEKSWSASTVRNFRNMIYTHGKPMLGMPVSQMTPEVVRLALTPMANTETARRTLALFKRVIEDAGGSLTYKLKGRVHHGHFAALPYQQVPALMKQLAQNRSLAARALEFLILTACPTQEVLQLRRSDIVDGVWSLSRLKTGLPFRVPLSTHALALVDECDLSGLGPQTLIRLLRKLHPTATVHGFRSVFSDWGFEQGGYDATLLDLCLGHKVNGMMRHYLRGDALDKRRGIMQEWANFCGGTQHRLKTPERAP